MTDQLVVPVILCGGAGTRLWPVSREKMPKQFVPLIGASSTFQQVLDRVTCEGLFAPPMIITNSEFRFVVAEQARARGVKATIILEPQRRDSAAAIAAAAELAVKKDSAAILLVVAADHLIPDTEEFTAACRAALPAAMAGSIVTFGVKPTYPASSYGYIRPQPAQDGTPVRNVEAFVEKPDEATAARYVADGYLWNSGNFMFRAEVMLRELARLEPEIKAAAKGAVDQLTSDLDFYRLAEGPFAQAPKKSIDYAVMERTALAAVLPVTFRWSDIGSWNAVWDAQDQDAFGNVIEGPVEVMNTSNSLIRSEETVLTTVIGLDGVIVIATADAVLVVAQQHAERVKDLVERLKAKNRTEALEHRRVYRPWGFYQSADSGSRYQVKRICVNPGARLSLQKHFHRSEHWVVVRGVAEVTIGEKVRLYHENESVYVPIGSVHRLANPGKIPLELIEVQVGTYLGEDDVVRLEVPVEAEVAVAAGAALRPPVSPPPKAAQQPSHPEVAESHGSVIGPISMESGFVQPNWPLRLPPDTERHISIWIGAGEKPLHRMLTIGRTYVLNFKVGEPVAGSLTTGPDATVSANDIPVGGMATEWTVLAHDAELAARTLDTAAAVVTLKGVQTWTGRFPLLIPQAGDSAVPQLTIKPLKANPRIDVVVTACGEVYRQFKILLAVSDDPNWMRAEPSRITDELMYTTTAHIGLSTRHEWTTPGSVLNVTVVRSLAVVQGNVGGTEVSSLEPWAGVPAQVSGPIKNVRDAAEGLRAAWENHLNDIPPADLADRLQRWGKQGWGGPEYDWRSLGDYADAGHRQQWDRMAVSAELRKLAQHGRRLFLAFFPPASNLRKWIAALPAGARLNIWWTPQAGAGFIPHVPWGLMYVADVPPDGQPVDPMGFVGLRNRLSYTSHPVQAASRALGGRDETHGAHFIYWGDAPTDITGQEARWQRSEWGRWPNQVFVPQAPQNGKAELLRMLNDPKPVPTSVLYLFCQCNTGAGNSPALRFGSTNDVANVVEHTELGTSPLTEQPFVFANACATVAKDPYMANELEEAFFDRGCRAYLGTETKVPIVLGSRFAAIFFHFFYRRLDPDPMAAGEAAAQTRIFLWTHYCNIGGLFYSYVNLYDLFLASETEVLALRR